VNKSKLIGPVLVGSLLLAGCVSSTTGPITPEADEADAAELNYQLGARYFRNGNYELARDRLLYSIELDPKRAVAHSTLALTYEQLGNMRLATESYEQAVRVAPRNYDVLNAYAVFLCRQQRYGEAEQYIERAVSAPANDNPEVMLTNGGVCLAQKPDYDKAEAYFRRALEEKANYGEALIQLALLKHAVGDDLHARAFLQRYLVANRADPGVLYLGYQIEGKLGDERARDDFAERLLREFPTSAETKRVLESD
jgi:type IV pilus assembly protein PilF